MQRAGCQRYAFLLATALFFEPGVHVPANTNNQLCHARLLLDYKVVYRRYASLYFIAGTDVDDNELMALELIHRYVEILDKWFSSVCELDIIFNFQQAYTILGTRIYF